MYHVADFREHWSHWLETWHAKSKHFLNYLSESNFWMAVIIMIALLMIIGMVLSLSYFNNNVEGSSQAPSPFLYGPFM
ncbi:MAG: hypothetical protein JEZ07_17225 [Phycisphaerae bacterium]|nr:hypothetical protein [Phycisphaerae bacterium]